MSKYLVIIEKSANGYAAYSPDLPGCVAAAKTKAQTEKLIRSAIKFHLEGLKAEGIRPPVPQASAEYVLA